MTPKRPLLSVVIPVYNGERFIREAVRTVVGQGWDRLEILVVDDGSTDGTKRAAQSLGSPVKYFYQKNKGPAAARNLGILKAAGNLIAFIDADDLWTPGRLDKMSRHFVNRPDLMMVAGYSRSELLPGTGTVPEKLLEPQLLPVFGACLFRRGVFGKIGLIDASLRLSEDQDWFMRVKESGVPVSILKEVVLIRRVHGENMTRGVDWRKAGILNVIRKSIQRRRTQNGGMVPDLPRLLDYEKEGVLCE